MSRAAVITPRARFLDKDGLTPLASGTLTFYEANSTNLATIYSDGPLSSSQSNPYTLGAGGTTDGDIRFSTMLTAVLKDSSGAEIRTIDDWTCFNEDSPFSTWNSTTTYGSGGANIVTHSDDYYVSLQAANLNKDPSSEAAWWQISYILTGSAASLTRLESIAEITPSQGLLIIGTATAWEGGVTIGSAAMNLLEGLTTSIGTDADHDIDIAAGSCMDSTNVEPMTITALTKQIDATWAAGDDAGGLASGLTVDDNLWYHIFVVKVGSSYDVMFDTSVVCQNGVDNNSVTYYRRIGSVKTDGSSNLVSYWQVGDYFYWDVMVQDVASANPGTSAVSPTITTPLGVSVTALILGVVRKDAGQTILMVTSPDQADTSPTSANSQCVAGQNPLTDLFYHQSFITVQTSTTSTIRYRLDVSTATTTVYINTVGWIDQRGQ